MSIEKKNIFAPQKSSWYKRAFHLTNIAPSISFIRILVSSVSVIVELAGGLIFLRKYRLSATIFGSARTNMPHDSYVLAERVGAFLAKRGYAVLTGGSKGIMEAANKGAHAAHGDSIGINIKLPFEQSLNPYLTDSFDSEYFFIRKTLLFQPSELYIFFPGGFGTFDELFSLLTIMQTGKTERLPVILVGKRFWTPVVEFMEKIMKKEFKSISDSDTDLFVLCDTLEEVENYVTSIHGEDCVGCEKEFKFFKFRMRK
ncbi:MAG: TIGR00730 family Rossman fold protein [Alphaproteobacteria bacterium]|nr:TIGR00730 family Rossman fold protein [Alphaproteobacteria bacterium]